eukprot:scaffold15989_cov54-Attheya_sp.AAC.4
MSLNLQRRKLTSLTLSVFEKKYQPPFLFPTRDTYYMLRHGWTGSNFKSEFKLKYADVIQLNGFIQISRVPVQKASADGNSLLELVPME